MLNLRHMLVSTSFADLVLFLPCEICGKQDISSNFSEACKMGIVSLVDLEETAQASTAEEQQVINSTKCFCFISIFVSTSPTPKILFHSNFYFQVSIFSCSVGELPPNSTFSDLFDITFVPWKTKTIANCQTLIQSKIIRPSCYELIQLIWSMCKHTDQWWRESGK